MPTDMDYFTSMSYKNMLENQKPFYFTSGFYESLARQWGKTQLVQEYFKYLFDNNKEDSIMNTKYELYEKLEDYLIVVGLPGFKKEDVKIQVKDKVMYITPKANENYDEQLSFDIDKISEDYGAKLAYGYNSPNQLLWVSSNKIYGLDVDPLIINLPEINEEVYADDIEAKMEDGLLKITIKKSGKITNVEIE